MLDSYKMPPLHEAAEGRHSWMELETKASKKARPLLPLSSLRTRAIKFSTDGHHYVDLSGAVLPEPRKSLNKHQTDGSVLFISWISALLQASGGSEITHLEVLYTFNGQALGNIISTWWGVEGGPGVPNPESKALWRSGRSFFSCLITWHPCLLPTHR